MSTWTQNSPISCLLLTGNQINSYLNGYTTSLTSFKKSQTLKFCWTLFEWDWYHTILSPYLCIQLILKLLLKNLHFIAHISRANCLGKNFRKILSRFKTDLEVSTGKLSHVTFVRVFWWMVNIIFHPLLILLLMKHLKYDKRPPCVNIWILCLNINFPVKGVIVAGI